MHIPVSDKEIKFLNKIQFHKVQKMQQNLGHFWGCNYFLPMWDSGRNFDTNSSSDEGSKDFTKGSLEDACEFLILLRHQPTVVTEFYGIDTR